MSRAAVVRQIIASPRRRDQFVPIGLPVAVTHLSVEISPPRRCIFAGIWVAIPESEDFGVVKYCPIRNPVVRALEGILKFCDAEPNSARKWFRQPFFF